MTRKRHIVIVDDEANIGRSLRLILEGEGHRVTVFDSAAAFTAQPNRAVADVYLLDVRLPDGSGLDLLRLVRQWDDRSAAVMISGHGTVADAVQATRMGAFDFLEKPLARDRVLLVVKNALEWSDLQRENQRFRELVGPAPKMIGSAPVFQQIVQQATQVAPKLRTSRVAQCPTRTATALIGMGPPRTRASPRRRSKATVSSGLIRAGIDECRTS